MSVFFYSANGKYGGFSNFSRHGFKLGGKEWRTSEHYFQAQKFVGTEHFSAVRQARTPGEAARRGRDRRRPLRRNWETVKDDVMRQAIMAKFRAHDDLRELLLSTGDEDIVENAPNDSYWGCGADGRGRNMLGRILVEARTILRGEQEE